MRWTTKACLLGVAITQLSCGSDDHVAPKQGPDVWEGGAHGMRDDFEIPPLAMRIAVERESGTVVEFTVEGYESRFGFEGMMAGDSLHVAFGRDNPLFDEIDFIGWVEGDSMDGVWRSVDYDSHGVWYATRVSP